MTWFRKLKKYLPLLLLAVLFLVPLGTFATFHYFKSRFFAVSPNSLRIDGDLHPFEFTWVSQKLGENYREPHSAILLPVTVPGIPEQLYMQFDTGSPSSFFRSGCLKSLQERGIQCELIEEDEVPYIRKFEVNVGGNRVLLEPARVMQRDIRIEWDKPVNIIGSIGADFIDDVVFAIDFPAETIWLFRQRPASFESLGSFTPFEFKARRVMLPTKIDGKQMQVFWDSGCSSFGLFTSKYHFDRYADENSNGIEFKVNRFGEKVPAHHKPCSLSAIFGDVVVPLKRVSYVQTCVGLQRMFGGFIDGGFFGNKSLTESTLLLDTKSNEFLIMNRSLTEEEVAVGHALAADGN